MSGNRISPLYYVLFGIPLGMVLFFVLFAFSSDQLFPSYNPFPFILNGDAKASAMNMSSADAKALVRLIRSGAVLNPQDLITELTAFYTLMFQAMAFLLAVFSAAAFLFIKARSEESIEKSVAAYVDTHLKSQEFYKHVQKHVDDFTAPYEDRMNGVDLLVGDLEEITTSEPVKRLNELEQQVKAIAEKLSKQDQSETIEADSKLDLDGD